MYHNLISTDYLIKMTSIDESVDPRILTPAIYNAQHIDLQYCLGQRMYEFIMDGITSSGNVNLNDDYKYLIREYIQPALVQFALVYCIPKLNYKFTNKAVSQKRSEYSDPSDLEVIKYLVLEQKNTARYSMERVKDYICNNISKFPQYKDASNNGVNSNSNDQYNCAIYISSKYRGAGNRGRYSGSNCDCGGDCGCGGAYRF